MAVRNLHVQHCTLWLFLLLLVVPFGRTSELVVPAALEYRLHFYYTHTGERLDIVYRRGDTYLPRALDELDHYLRDHRTGEVRHFDPHLFDVLYDLTASLNDTGGEIDVVCGYRTPWSNEFLRTRSAHTGVARHSLHMQAEAIDIRVPRIPRAVVRDAALHLHRGGSVTIALPTSYTWTWDACVAGSASLTRDTDNPSPEPSPGRYRVRKCHRRSERHHRPAR